MYVFSAFLGLFTGAAQGIYTGAMASLIKDPQMFGVRFGMTNLLMSFAALGGPPIAGAIINADGGRHTLAQVWAGVMLMIASFLFISVGISLNTWKLKV